MATDILEKEQAASETAPAKASANKASNKKRVAKKPKAKKASVKKRVPKKTVAAKKSAAKKSVAQKPTNKKQPATPATTKAQSIRDTANELGKKARPKDIIAALAEKGITVTSPQVSMTLKAAGLRRGRRKAKVEKTVVAANKASQNGKHQTFNVNDLIQVRALAIKLGGIDKLKETLAALEKLQGIWFGV